MIYKWKCPTKIPILTTTDGGIYMNIDKILEYQKVDMEFMKLEDEMRTSDVAKKLIAYQGERKRAVEEVKRLNSIAEELFGNFDTVNESYDKISKDIEEIQQNIGESAEDDMLDFYNKRLDQCIALLDSYEKELNRIITELSRAKSTFESEMDNANKAAALEKNYLGKFEEMKKEKMGQAKVIDAKRKEIAKDVDEELMKVYLDGKKRGKRPVFVPYLADNHACSCGVEVSAEVRDKMENGTLYCECPNCGRIMYNRAK